MNDPYEIRRLMIVTHLGHGNCEGCLSVTLDYATKESDTEYEHVEDNFQLEVLERNARHLHIGQRICVTLTLLDNEPIIETNNDNPTRS